MSATSDKRRSPRQAFLERARFLATTLLAVFLLGWLSWFWPYDDWLDRSGTPLAADFSMFYVAGQTVLGGETSQLYDPAAAQARLVDLFPGIDPHFALPYRYPPLVGTVMAPLACLPYPVAALLFMTLGLVSALAGLRLLVSETGIGGTRIGGTGMGDVAASDTGRTWNGNQRLCYLALLSWPVVLETWIGGQASLFALLIVCLGIVLMQREQDTWAGAVWALAAYKPNVLLLVVIGCVLFRPRVLRGLLPVGAALLGLTWLTTGWSALVEYAELTLQLAARPWDVETPFWKVHSFSQWLTLVVGDQARIVTLLLGLLATIGVVWRWRGTGNAPRAPLPYALLITINALANPYTPIYDLTLLAAGVILMVASEETSRRYPLARYAAGWQIVLAALYFGPHLSQLIAKSSGVQFFPLLLLGYAVFQARLFWLETRSAVGPQPDMASTLDSRSTAVVI